MWLWDYIMLVRQRQAARRNVRVPLVYIGTGESPHQYSHMCMCLRVLVAQFHSLFVFRHLSTTETRVQYHTEKALY